MLYILPPVGMNRMSSSIRGIESRVPLGPLGLLPAIRVMSLELVDLAPMAISISTAPWLFVRWVVPGVSPSLSVPIPRISVSITTHVPASLSVVSRVVASPSVTPRSTNIIRARFSTSSARVCPGAVIPVPARTLAPEETLSPCASAIPSFASVGAALLLLTVLFRMF